MVNANPSTPKMQTNAINDATSISCHIIAFIFTDLIFIENKRRFTTIIMQTKATTAITAACDVSAWANADSLVLQ